MSTALYTNYNIKNDPLRTLHVLTVSSNLLSIEWLFGVGETGCCISIVISHI